MYVEYKTETEDRPEDRKRARSYSLKGKKEGKEKEVHFSTRLCILRKNNSTNVNTSATGSAIIVNSGTGVGVGAGVGVDVGNDSFADAGTNNTASSAKRTSKVFVAVADCTPIFSFMAYNFPIWRILF